MNINIESKEEDARAELIRAMNKMSNHEIIVYTFAGFEGVMFRKGVAYLDFFEEHNGVIIYENMEDFQVESAYWGFDDFSFYVEDINQVSINVE
jgi:hypothetical protein